MKRLSRPSFKSFSRHPKRLSVMAVDTLPKPVTVNFDKLPPELRLTLLSQAVCMNQLPIAIRVTESFLAKGSPITTRKGTLLLLCFVVEVPVVHAVVDKDVEYRLPLHATQLYEKLPLGKGFYSPIWISSDKAVYLSISSSRCYTTMCGYFFMKNFRKHLYWLIKRNLSVTNKMKYIVLFFFLKRHQIQLIDVNNPWETHISLECR